MKVKVTGGWGNEREVEINNYVESALDGDDYDW